MALYAVHGTRPWTSYSFSSCTTLIVSIFQFALSFLRFGAKKLGPHSRIWILMSGPPVENRNTLVSQKRVQRYNKFLNPPNIFAKKCTKKCTFFITRWLSVWKIFTFFCSFLRYIIEDMFWISYLIFSHIFHNIYNKERVHAHAIKAWIFREILRFGRAIYSIFRCLEWTIFLAESVLRTSADRWKPYRDRGISRGIVRTRVRHGWRAL